MLENFGAIWSSLGDFGTSFKVLKSFRKFRSKLKSSGDSVLDSLVLSLASSDVNIVK